MFCLDLRMFHISWTNWFWAHCQFLMLIVELIMLTLLAHLQFCIFKANKFEIIFSQCFQFLTNFPMHFRQEIESWYRWLCANFITKFDRLLLNKSVFPKCLDSFAKKTSYFLDMFFSKIMKKVFIMTLRF